MFLLVFVRELREKSEIGVKPNTESFKKEHFCNLTDKTNRS